VRLLQKTIVLIVTLLAFALIPALRATTFMRLSPEQMAAAATFVVRARCVGSIVLVDRGEIWTLTSFETREAWKGAPPETLRVRLLGGRTRELTSQISGVPRFRPGEDVVLFLVPEKSGGYSIVSWAQGTFRVHRDPASRALVITQDTAAYGFRLSERASHPPEIVRDTPLEEFRRRIQSASASAAAAPSLAPARAANRRQP